jgi:hypothetical protein
MLRHPGGGGSKVAAVALCKIYNPTVHCLVLFVRLIHERIASCQGQGVGRSFKGQTNEVLIRPAEGK